MKKHIKSIMTDTAIPGMNGWEPTVSGKSGDPIQPVSGTLIALNNGQSDHLEKAGIRELEPAFSQPNGEYAPVDGLQSVPVGTFVFYIISSQDNP